MEQLAEVFGVAKTLVQTTTGVLGTSLRVHTDANRVLREPVFPVSFDRAPARKRGIQLLLPLQGNALLLRHFSTSNDRTTVYNHHNHTLENPPQQLITEQETGQLHRL